MTEPQTEPRTPASDTSVLPRPLPDQVRAFLDDLRFATISTIDPDGRPRQAVVWYAVDGDEIVINSAIGRRWPTNLLRDPRLSFTVIDAVDQYRWVGLTGTVATTTDWADDAGRYRRDGPSLPRRRAGRGGAAHPRPVRAPGADHLPVQPDDHPRRARRMTRFGLQLWSQHTDWPAFRDSALAAEEAGWDLVWTWDHRWPSSAVGAAIFEG